MTRDRINSKKKGSKNERDICKLFEEWTGYKFSRTPSSGGLHWGRKDTIGDVVCTDEKHSRRFKFAIEAKFYKDISFQDLINGNKGSDILKFWEQAKSDARGIRIPMVMMRYNGMKKGMNYIVLYAHHFEEFKPKIGNSYGILEYISLEHHLVILNSYDFFNSEYKTIHKIAKTLLSNEKGK